MLPMIAATLVLANPLYAQELPPPPMVNGTTTSDYPAVGALLACETRGCFQFCSGTLIDKGWVLTAGHCDDAELAGYDIVFMVGKDVYNIDDYAYVSDMIQHPDFNLSQLKNDIALFELSSNITSVDPMPLNFDTVNSSWIGEELTYVGYGITTDDAYDNGYKRTADMPVFDYDSQFIYAYDGTDHQNLCSGDSGGAALEHDGGSLELAGVNSWVAGYDTPGKSCEGGYNGVTRVDQYTDWIQTYVDLSNTSGGGGGSGDGGSSGGGSGDGGSSGGGSGDGGSSGGGSGDGGSSGGEDTGWGDLWPGGSGGGSGDGGDDSSSDTTLADLLGCSSVPAPAGGVFALSMLALAGRRRRRDGAAK